MEKDIVENEEVTLREIEDGVYLVIGPPAKDRFLPYREFAKHYGKLLHKTPYVELLNIVTDKVNNSNRKNLVTKKVA